MLTWQELWTYGRTLLRWWPVLALATVLAAGTAWFLSRDQPDFYRARASLMVGNNFVVSSPDRFAVEVSNSLARYYEVLVRREVILGPVAEKLGLTFPWQLISDRMLYTEINPQANLIEIVVTDSSPERAAAIANAIGESLIAYSPNSADQVATQRAEVDRQIAESQAAVEETDRRLAELAARQQQLNAAVDLRENQEQIGELEAARERYQQTYNSLLALRDNSSINTLSFFERATMPGAPLPQKTSLVIGGAGLGGLLVAVVAVFLLDMLDERWRPDPDLRRRMGITHLGRVHYQQGDHKRGVPRAEEREVRETHTRMVLAASDRPLRLLLVSSPEPSEERSAYAIDLAGVYGRAGHRVLLVDAELARSHVTHILAEREGGPERTVGAAIERWSKGGTNGYKIPPELWVRLRPTPIANVALLPGRSAGGDPFPILVPLLHWPELVSNLRDVADVIIFDGPSALGSADAALLAPLVDGVVLVLDPGEHSRAQIAESRARLLRSQGSRLLGAVTVDGRQRRRAGSTRRGSFRIAVDRRGLTITLPARGGQRAETPLLEDSGTSGDSGASSSPRPDGWGAFRPEELMRERSVGEPDVVIMPPSAPGPTGRTIITPPPFSEHEPRRTIVTPAPDPAAPEARPMRAEAHHGRARRSPGRGARARAGRQQGDAQIKHGDEDADA